MKPLVTLQQASAYESPWPVGMRIKLVLWILTRNLICRQLPKPLFRIHVLMLKLFGAKVTGRPFVARTANVKFPWNLTLEDRACIGPDAQVYNLGRITLKARCTIAQDVYLCAGTHDFSKKSLPLVVGEIVVGEDAFVGVRALILPGVEIGTGALVGAGAVVTKDVPPWMVAAGNPAKPIKPRVSEGNSDRSCE